MAILQQQLFKAFENSKQFKAFENPFQGIKNHRQPNKMFPVGKEF